MILPRAFGSQDPTTTHSEYAFLQYAVKYWLEHYRLAPSANELEEQVDGLEKRMRNLLAQSSSRKKWYNLFQNGSSDSQS
jgi:hypothetical protein